MNALCHTYVHVMHMNESCLTYESRMKYVVSLNAVCHMLYQLTHTLCHMTQF